MGTRKEIFCCESCGRDTTNKCRVCKLCMGGQSHAMENASATMTCWTEWAYEVEGDYSEDALGPKLMENRMYAIWLESQREQRRHEE